MTNFKSIYDYCRELVSSYPTLTEYETLTIATQMQRNDILRAGLVVSQNDETPSALEGIAMQLGIMPDGKICDEYGTLPFDLGRIADELEGIKTHLEEK